MAGKVRPVRTPPAALIQTGEGNKGYRFMSGSMGAAALPPPGGPMAAEPFEAAIELSATEIAQREAALGLPPEPEGVPGATEGQYLLRTASPPSVWRVPRQESGEAYAPRATVDLSILPDHFALEIERKGGMWLVRASSVHHALFVADADLIEALTTAPSRLAEIIAVDGIVPSSQRKRKRDK